MRPGGVALSRRWRYRRSSRWFRRGGRSCGGLGPQRRQALLDRGVGDRPSGLFGDKLPASPLEELFVALPQGEDVLARAVALGLCQRPV